MALNENPTLEEIVDEVERLNNLIVNRGGAQTITPAISNQTLSKGYYKGNITIKGDANLIASNIISGKSIFGVSGSATVSSLGGKKWASGRGTSTSTSVSCDYYSSGTNFECTITVNGLSFKPSFIFAYREDDPSYISLYHNDKFFSGAGRISSGSAQSVRMYKPNDNIKIISNGFTMPIQLKSVNVVWIAYE